ncbi:MAG: cache domain-containing protein [Candidatus Cloacimonetes bacterium]|nr:cache domain-containing protein [Candidatus Cloacimonadota bacterium]MCF7814269.1 cache domain-containing protein [Candidatus Cloacimonadota bacterium]MCF7868930.1 cache domain-containing protein [Candidatus Cloacimonadota bacterium]MCF7884311.1 cache domain-containing protein [Candidatus Cloacimonadota bacterium]
MKKIILAVLLFSLILLSCGQKEEKPEIEIKVPDLTMYEHQQTKDVVQLVYDAVNEIELKGVDAFAQFRVKGSKWFQDETYIFVWGIDGLRYVYPPDPAGEGKNMKDLKDINEKPIGREFIEAADNDEGWVFYMWTKPGETEPEQKTTFIKRAIDADKKVYLVGCGLYGMPQEKVFEE